MKLLTALALGAIITLAGCAMNNEQSGRAGGTIIGAGLGALAGDLVDCKGCAAIGGVLGAIAGGYIGGNIGRSMDRTDRLYLNRAIDQNRTYQKTVWTNPDTQNTYTVQPTKTYSGPKNQPCREFILGEKKVGGKMEEVYANACYDGHGGWVLQPQQ